MTKILWIAVPVVFLLAAAMTLLGPRPARNPEVWLFQIVVRADKSDPDDIERAEKKIQDLYEQLAAGAELQQLARKNSEAQNSMDGGDMGWMGEGVLPPDLEEQAFGLTPGYLSEIIESDFEYDTVTYRILYVKERRNF
jgi:parvulin-like peptidyl-prolyl isomerase